MTTIALSERKILVPRLEFPRWLRLPRGVSDERVARMFSGAFRKPFQNAFASTDGAPHWATINGEIDAAHIAAWTPKGAASLAASYVQYGTLGSGLSVGVAPSWDATNGWKGDGTQWLNSGVSPSTTNSFFIAFSSAAESSGLLFGASNNSGSRYTYINPNRVSGSSYWLYRGASVSVLSPSAAAGVAGMAKNNVWLNGTNIGTSTIADTGTWGNTFYIFAANYGSAVLIKQSYIQAIVIYDLELTTSQASALSTAMAAL